MWVHTQRAYPVCDVVPLAVVIFKRQNATASILSRSRFFSFHFCAPRKYVVKILLKFVFYAVYKKLEKFRKMV